MGIKLTETNLKIAGIILILILAYFPVFLHLDNLSIREWDEARLSINAYEMYRTGNFIVTHFNGHPDMWNTKPPLMIWLQTIGMHIWGPGELAVRLPSALAAYLLIIGLLFFNLKYTKEYWFGIFTVLVLITANGFIQKHASRTGDYDSLLTMFTTFHCLAFFYYLETRKIHALYLALIMLTLAVLTKGIQGLLFTPGLFIYVLIRRKLIMLIKNKHFYFGFLIFIFMSGGYYILRESVNPGYLNAVYNNELGGRYLEGLEEHRESFWFYFNNIHRTFFKEWFWFLPLGIITGLITKINTIRRITLFSVIMIVPYFLIISSSQTKLYWYDVPLYPFYAMICAAFVYFVFTLIKNHLKLGPAWVNSLLLIVLVGGLYFKPYSKVINRIYQGQSITWEQETFELQYYLRKALKENDNLKNDVILHEGNIVPLMFYVNELNDKGMNVRFIQKEELKKGDKVIVDQEQLIKFIEENFSFEILYTGSNIKIYKINGTDR